MEDLQTKEPPVSFRYHDNVDEETFRLAINVALTGGSHPAFFNDNNSIPALINIGFTLEQARNWCLLGCTEPIVPGLSDYQSMLGFFNTIKVFEITLYGGKDPVTGKQIGPETGNARDFTSIEQLKEAYLTQQAYFIKRFVGKFNRMVSAHAYTMPTLLASAFTQGCIEKGSCCRTKEPTIDGMLWRQRALGISQTPLRQLKSVYLTKISDHVRVDGCTGMRLQG